MDLRKKLTYSEAKTLISQNIKLFKKLYISKNLTARKIAENQNIHFDNNFQKALLRVLGKKKAGWGGRRENSGNKKGIRFCKICKKKSENCNCK